MTDPPTPSTAPPTGIGALLKRASRKALTDGAAGRRRGSMDVGSAALMALEGRRSARNSEETLNTRANSRRRGSMDASALGEMTARRKGSTLGLREAGSSSGSSRISTRPNSPRPGSGRRGAPSTPNTWGPRSRSPGSPRRTQNSDVSTLPRSLTKEQFPLLAKSPRLAALHERSLLIAGNGFNPFRDQTIEPAEETAPWDGALDATLHVFHSQHRPAVEDNKFNIDRPDFLSISSASPRLSLTSPPRPSIVSMIASGNSKMPQAGKIGSPRKWNKPPQVGLLRPLLFHIPPCSSSYTHTVFQHSLFQVLPRPAERPLRLAPSSIQAAEKFDDRHKERTTQVSEAQCSARMLVFCACALLTTTTRYARMAGESGFEASYE